MTTAPPVTLADWLMERIAEDEKHAREAGGQQWGSWNRSWDDTARDIAAPGEGRLFACPVRFDEHVARHDPARVLAECESKRRILELHRDGDAWCDHCSGWYGDDPAASCPTLLLLALPYADCDGFREEWRL